MCQRFATELEHHRQLVQSLSDDLCGPLSDQPDRSSGPDVPSRADGFAAAVDVEVSNISWFTFLQIFVRILCFHVSLHVFTYYNFVVKR